MRNAIIAILIFCGGSASSETALTPGQTRSVLSEGKILSSASLSLGASNSDGLGLAAATPQGTRIHEIFVYYKDEIYLCHLVGAKDSGTPPYASCVGYRNNL